ncbi:hypothetical protein AcV7_001325 [Taiwanofungus camphoratus]|nr:hypothetical protein AcW2_000172 [Antrodia cinnamomea]KAI0962489.1 hypothetical protein AcV7_001325 [Antrodia cinnamomea]
MRSVGANCQVCLKTAQGQFHVEVDAEMDRFSSPGCELRRETGTALTGADPKAVARVAIMWKLAPYYELYLPASCQVQSCEQVLLAYAAHWLDVAGHLTYTLTSRTAGTESVVEVDGLGAFVPLWRAMLLENIIGVLLSAAELRAAGGWSGGGR